MSDRQPAPMMPGRNRPVNLETPEFARRRKKNRAKNRIAKASRKKNR